MRMVAKTYRVGPRATSVLIVLIMAVLWGCSSDAAARGEADDGHQVADDLYRSILVVFEEETEGIDLRAEESFLVVSNYEELSPERRRRFVGEVVPVGVGMGVRITAEYQVEREADGESRWVDEPRPRVEAEAGPEELRLARRVERVYHRRDF